jgi:cyclopropane fatty-acyl-phospholipid synthase-like methyltransferase
MKAIPDAPATARNKDAILQVLQYEFRDCKSVFEIGSGTGQHAVYFAAAMHWLVWQTSELPENHEGIRAWIDSAKLPNVRPPLAYDAGTALGIGSRFDAVFSANTAHIMSMGEVGRMFSHVSQLLNPEGRFCLYGPFNENGRFTSDSNATFDAGLRARKSSMGLRDRQELNRLARENGMIELPRYAMPANNQLLIWTPPLRDPASR